VLVRLIRDFGRTMLLILLIACAAAIAGLGATVHIFTRQQIKTVDESSITMAVRHTGSVSYGVGNADHVSYEVRREPEMLETLNAHESVKVPALIKAFAALDASVTPVYSGDAAYYNWSRDADIARTVMTVTCIKDKGIVSGTTTWEALVLVDAVYVPLPYDIPEQIRVIGSDSGFAPQPRMVPGQSYLVCGRYEDYYWDLDLEASLSKGYYDPVYKPDKSQPPILRLQNWNDDIRPDHYMKYISTPDDTGWRDMAVTMADKHNRQLQLNCINDLNRLRWFANGEAMIVDGRSFTPKEQESGAQVCIISKELAEANGLSVGDRISMNVNQPRVNRWLWATPDMLNETYGFVNLYDFPGEDRTDPRGVDVTLEIIGIYTAPLYKNTIDEFTPNTVFAPYEAVAFEFDMPLLFTLPVHTQNLILHNGQGDAFLQAVRDAGYPDGLYTIEETNYEVVEEILAYMSTDSLTLLAISASVGAVMLIVVLALYARGWHKENAILAMLGTTKACIGWRMLGSLTVLTLLGSAAAFGGMCAVKSYIEEALNSVYIGSSSDFSAIRVGAFSEEGMTIGVEVIAAALGLTAVAFLLIAAVQSIISARKKVRECLFD